jgi:hypothetical protein
MKHATYLVCMLLIFPATRLLAQNVDDPDSTKRLFNMIKIRKAFESLDDKKEPALISATFPEEGKNSYLINAGVSFRLAKVTHSDKRSTKMTFEPFFILNRNTLIDEKQKNHKTGIAWNWKWGSYKNRNVTYKALTTSAEYMWDKMDTANSIVITSYYSPIRSCDKEGSLSLNTYKAFGKHGFLYFVAFTGGLEYQNKIEAKSDELRGSVGRVYYCTEFRLVKKIPERKGEPASIGLKFIELVLSNKGRYDVVNATDKNEGYLPSIKAEISLFPTLDKDLGVSFSYNSGADPINGLKDQDFFLVAVKIKK